MARGEGVDRGGSGPGGASGGSGAGGSTGGVGGSSSGLGGLGEQAPGSGPRGGFGTTDQAPGSGPTGGFGTTDQAPGSGPRGGGGDDQVRGNIQPGGTASQAAFGAFSEQTSGVIGKLKEAFGFGPKVGALAIAGAKAADPASFESGQKAGVGLDVASAVSTLTGNLPTRAALSIIDKLSAALANPAFSVGRQSLTSPTEGVASIAGAVAGRATGSIGVAKAVSLGISLGGIAQSAEDAGLSPPGLSAPTPVSDDRSTVRAQRISEQAVARTGALIETSTSELPASRPRALVTRENLGQQSLRIRRV